MGMLETTSRLELLPCSLNTLSKQSEAASTGCGTELQTALGGAPTPTLSLPFAQNPLLRLLLPSWSLLPDHRDH